MLPLLLLLCLQTSLQQTLPPGRCDISQRVDVYTACTSCAIKSSCPHGFSNVDTTNCSYVVHISRELELEGCQHVCVKTFMEPRCCPQFWGPLCLPCPSWSGKTCNFHGNCLDGDVGNGTCVCDEGFSGFACQECQNEKAYGEKCDKECECVHGVCNKGPEGDGQCLCQPPYTGKRCDQVSTRCTNCSPFSYCKGDGDEAVCECLPGYRKTPQGKCASVCSGNDCDVNAQCSSQGSKVSCACKPDYEGDGRICVPKNPCSENNGGCPVNSTICVFKGPNKSSCECMAGMSPIEGNADLGCQLVSACSVDSCDSTAICQTELDGLPRCLCRTGEIGDGRRCYGNVLTQLRELNMAEGQRGNLTGAIALFGNGCSMLSNGGPFTAFIPLLKTPLTGVNEEQVCKNHLILGQFLNKDLEGRDFNLYGGAALRSKGNKRFILLDDPSKVYTIIHEDLPASNGIIHIIDQPITNTLSDKPPRDEQYADITIGEILTKDGKFNRFLSLVDNCGSPLPLRGPGPLTVFVPTNQAVDRARDGSILYMLNEAKHKLQELLRHHIFSQAVLAVDELASLPQIQTMANQIVTISASNDGKILLGEKGVQLASSNIVASNGIIHMIDGLLYPPSILPILPHRCDIVEHKITVGPCVHCSYLYQTDCPEGSTELAYHQTGCEYVTSPLRPTLSPGCAKFCNTTKQVAECCKGFYGPDCKPCIGGFQHPCYDKGTCFDGIQGNGSCSCQSGFKGVACHICSDPSKFGDKCDEECHCMHGVCDNRPGSGGVCRRGSCLEGYSGENCDKTATPCNSDGLHEHCHIHAYCTQTGLHTLCVCKDGYEGDGHSCSAINPCLKSDRGGCDTNAQCTYVGPGNASCVCNEGWTGDGKVCVEINNCQLESRGGCSPNADCNHIGPGQSECVCKTGYMGDGIVCDLINPCSKRNGGCHDLAKCELREGGTHTCTCADGYAGDGTICYGSLLDELDMNLKLYSFHRLVQKYRYSSEDLSGNLTVFVPSREALRNVTLTPESFWTSRHRLPHFLRAHFVPGIYSIEDLDKLVGTNLPTMNLPTQWEISNSSAGFRIGDASITTHNMPAINGYIHIIDKILAPSRSDLPPEPPSLLAFLNSSSFTLFREYVLMYNLSEELKEVDFTLLLPTDDAIRQHLSKTNSSVLDSDLCKYHVIKNELLFPDHLSDGMVKSTLLGNDYQVQFHLNNDNQTVVNDVPLDGTFIETQYGVVMILPQVLTVRRNRCSQEVTLQVNGRCADCEGPPRCLFSYKPIKPQFPANMRSNCKYRKRIGSRRKSVPGCVIKCLRTTTDHSCCPGYYGHECFKCPGDVGSWCSNHGECQDGNYGNGECRCYEGFHGTACENCEPGRYGVNCSSKCVCDHGKCEDGLEGSGRCVCYKGWKGSACSIEIKDDACGGVCDENANCITGPKGSAAACVCVAGYEGNGTYCKELDLCSRFNGGCSEFAVCTKVSAGERTCTCREGYTGDGVVCLEIDGCLVNNGGCHMSADCIRTGPNTTTCMCRMGFRGSGRYCFPVNPCRNNNGGCSRQARCEYLGQGHRNCTCHRGYLGDGFDCRGSVSNELSRHPENSFFHRMMARSSNVRGIYGEGPYTVFVPVEETNNDTSFMEWYDSGRLHEVIRYHIVACETLTLSDLKTTNLAVAMSGHTLHFSLQQGSVWVNNRSRIVKSDYTTFNGVIHHIDTMLTPYRLHDKPKLQPLSLNLTTAAAFYGYSRFYKLVEDAGLLPILQMSLHQPLTMFWPTDEAINALSAERQRWLFSPDHQEQLAATVKAHIIRDTSVLSLFQKLPFRTMHGSTIKFSCDKTMVGGVLINDNAAKVVEPYLSFREGMAYGIDQLLEPPGLGAHCDSIENKTSNGRCGRCYFTPPCPFRHQDTGRTEPCLSSRLHFGGGYPHWSGNLDHFSMMGCQRICQYTFWASKCCKNHYGRDCQVCPGGVEAPCGNHGDCDDGLGGSGRCRCHKGFKGAACELCVTDHYGPNCTACSCERQGRCEDGIEGSGQCVCNPGWKGDRCQIEIGSIPEECQQCHIQADCVPGVGCQCKSGFQGNGTFCSAEPPPDLCAEYNGGCHQNADCNQTGLVVNCTCRSGYQGDGFSCDPVNRCVEEQNGGCSDFATCKFTGPNERECECLPGYVGNGVQCMEKVVPPVDRCLENNGDCDPAAICKDLHYHANTAGVFHLRSPEGKYKMNFSQADAACQAEGATLATFKQLGDAQQLGMHLCVAGWMEGGKVGYPTRFPSVKCGDNHVGLVIYKEPVDQTSKYDAYCYRLKDVSCTCPAGYVGDGAFCNGVLTDILATNSDFSIFYKLLLDYSGSSSEGKKLVEFLSHRKSDVTLFVPRNDGFAQNKTVSGRDLEYHISANNSRRPFKELRHQEVIVSRLGFNLTVTHGNNESFKMVNQQRLLIWDIPAVNGLIHMIEAPLTAPPAPPSHHASRGHAHSSGTVSAILVSVFLACLLAALGYYVFKHKTDAFRFHYFRNDDEDAAPGGRTKPTLVSIPNPLYSGSRAFSEPFGDAGQGTEPAEPEEPPNILDLDSETQD